MLLRRWKSFYAPNRDGVPLGLERTLADKPAYQNGSIDTNFGPPRLPLDSTFVLCNSTKFPKKWLLVLLEEDYGKIPDRPARL